MISGLTQPVSFDSVNDGFESEQRAAIGSLYFDMITTTRALAEQNKVVCSVQTDSFVIDVNQLQDVSALCWQLHGLYSAAQTDPLSVQTQVFKSICGLIDSGQPLKAQLQADVLDSVVHSVITAHERATLHLSVDGEAFAGTSSPVLGDFTSTSEVVNDYLEMVIEASGGEEKRAELLHKARLAGERLYHVDSLICDAD